MLHKHGMACYERSAQVDGLGSQAMRYITAARVPRSLAAQDFGLWHIRRQYIRNGPFNDMTALCKWTMATLHLTHGEVVMEDSVRELSRHLPIWLRASGRVLVTGLGLGCVVRGLLANPEVAEIDVVEIDPHVMNVIGDEFIAEPRVNLILGDALNLEWMPGTAWDYAWHDLFHEDGNGALQALHAQLLLKYREACAQQGAWAFPRDMARRCARPLINAPRRRIA